MKTVYYFFSLLIIALISGCGIGNDVTVLNFSPTGKVNSLTTFRIEFSKNLAPDSLLNEWVRKEYIEFTPKIEGQYKWVTPSTLVFSPDFPLDPIQQYKARITQLVLSGTQYSANFDDFEFFTPGFDVVSVDIFWTNIPNQYYKLTTQANIKFNYAVNPSQLKQFLEVTRNGQLITQYEILNNSSSEIIAINFGEVQQTDKEQEFVITVKKGLMSLVGKEGLVEDRTVKTDLPPITELAVTGVSSGFDGTNGWIEVTTTQTIDEKNAGKFIQLEPKKDFSLFVSDNTFRIEANLSSVSEVHLKLRKGLPGLYGGKLDSDFEQMVSLIDLEPSVSFTDRKGKYLKLYGERNISLNAVNTDEIEVSVSQIFPNNIVHFLNNSAVYSYNSDYDWGYNDYYVGDYGKPLYTEKLKTSGRQNWLEKVTINLNKIFENKQKGIYVLRANSSTEYWRYDSKIVSLSDLGIIAKKGPDEVLVFVNSIETTKPVSNVEITLLSSSNQTLLKGTTNADGIIKFSGVKEKIGEFVPVLITAETKNDFNYIDLRETEIDQSRYDIAGERQYSEDFTSFVYSERNLYRPGESVNISSIVRKADYNPASGLPVVLKVLNPLGQKYDEFTTKLNTEGSCEFQFRLADYAATGNYSVELYSGPEIIGGYSFSVEEFAPDKIRLNVKNDVKSAVPGDNVPFSFNAEYLFGAKASGLRYDVSIGFEHKDFTSKNYPDFVFGQYAQSVKPAIQNYFLDGYLDDNGNASLSYTVPSDISGNGIVSAVARISVFDVTGRTVTRGAFFDIYPNPVYTGFIPLKKYYYSVNENIPIRLIALNTSDKPESNVPLTLELIRFEWQTALQKDVNGRYAYTSVRKEITEWKKTITLFDVNNTVNIKGTKSGEYELRIMRKGADSYQVINFYTFDWFTTSASSYEVDKDGKINIQTDKPVYKPGETAKILFTTPFSGKMLVTVERSGILYYQYVFVDKNSAELKLPIKEGYLPNVYISATLFRAHTKENNSPFLAGHGYAALRVEESSNNISVKINAPAKIKPGRRQNVTVSTNAGSDVFVTLAAVDEGILQIKNYKTPDVYSTMYAMKPLIVEGYDLYKLLLPEFISLKSPGGDAALRESLEKRANPITVKRFQLLSYWSGIKRTGADGKITIPVAIPQFNGEVRLMAVAYKGKKFGSGSSYMKVFDDIILESQVPRFLTSYDSLFVPVTIINTTARDGNVEVQIKTDGPIAVTGLTKQSVFVKANSTKTVNFALKTWDQIGAGKVTFTTSGIASVKEVVDLAVRPASPFVTETGAGELKAGNEIEITYPNDFVSSTKKYTVTLSKFPAVRFAKQLKNLIGYPHGCLEQTVSKAFPLLYFSELAKVVAPEQYRTNAPAYYVKEAVKKIESMQLYDGSFAYWQGSGEYNWWSSVYATHFLVEAQRAGYQINRDALEKALGFLGTKVKQQLTVDYVVSLPNGKQIKKIAPKEIIYSLYVIASAGKADFATMNYYRGRMNLLSRDMVYVLAGSYALAGKWNSYYDLVPQSFASEKTARSNGGNFDSEFRADALMLNVLLDVDPANKQIPYIISHLANNANQLYNTQEQAFVFLALGKAAVKSQKSDVKVQVFAGDKQIGSYSGKDLTIQVSSGNKIKLKTSGSGSIYYFWSAEGVKSGGKVKEEDNFISARRTYYDLRSGRAITDNIFEQGQLLVCRLTISAGISGSENIAISDLIPSGFEIENPRLSESLNISWLPGKSFTPDYMDIRDDRIILFTSLNSGESKDFYYILRVVNLGKFQLPVLGAEAMYNPEFHSYSGGGSLRVNKFAAL